jgi:uncharacterized membrane protein
MSASVIVLFSLRACLISTCAFFKTLGFLIISVITQSTIVDELIVSAKKHILDKNEKKDKNLDWN